ncbi:hypothetical protein M8332_06895 (plasmid) [Fructilactobacillus ixorae]|uniref:Phage protein n=1 Tax=Fructilactobacillus ixorae TaxID=1750535 RepID=A0ABY5C8V2_9LACO|nr:hypothetical protein [Fructilactobacillus ixorae]USS94008.1 hypothetical protein M8332_06895 [Fructilactobacillus ixorae]
MNLKREEVLSKTHDEFTRLIYEAKFVQKLKIDEMATAISKVFSDDD